ncbi:hypothetical protein B0H17DRAFT_1086138 [Mycena rosella]|uniref:Protein kinase domain-containing protein n=1 Tax=Mycena rosella TaxID=1033263 RepID=A0AAD7G5N6_MYCRO|nr:hypothetical protein B0H17DRAFT_1086138 [Mycena rosella]
MRRPHRILTGFRHSISSTLAALRGEGIHHHDVHGKNVLWKNGSAYLTDFGRATTECVEGEDCPDLPFILEDDLATVPNLIPSTSQSSTEAPTTASRARQTARDQMGSCI